tara:strand:+ start:279 stop:1592 length:1314 start_codon:yes stop_codon:yes gene_type:complete
MAASSFDSSSGSSSDSSSVFHDCPSFIPSISGRAKITSAKRIPETIIADTYSINHRGHSYGQDYVISIPLPKSSGYIQILADGNGENGEVVSMICAESLLTNLLEKYEKLLALCISGDMPNIECIMNQAFKDADESLLILAPLIATNSGSTCTVLLVLIHKKRRYILTSYIGDSPAMIVCSDGHYQYLTKYVHNPENIHEWRRHIKNMQQKGLEPEQYALHRANCSKGPSVPYPSTDLRTPIPLYIPDDNGDYKVNMKGVEALHSVGMPIGGAQSLRRYIEKDPVTDQWVSLPGHEHENMASTVNGGTQLTRCFGTFFQKPQVDSTPTSILSEVLPQHEYYAVILSDGAGDTMFMDPKVSDFPSWVQRKSVLPFVITDMMKDDVKPALLSEYLITHSLKLGDEDNHPSYTISSNSDGLLSPSWDDCSAVSVYLPKIV